MNGAKLYLDTFSGITEEVSKVLGRVAKKFTKLFKQIDIPKSETNV